MAAIDPLRILEKAGAHLTNDHFVYKSGLHGDKYLDKDAALTDPRRAKALGTLMAKPFHRMNIQIVAGPAIGGALIAQWVAYALWAPMLHVQAVYAENVDDRMVFRRGYDKRLEQQRVLVVEDILTTGGSAKKVVDAVRGCQGAVLGVSALCNRGGVNKEAVGNPTHFNSLVDIDLKMWPADDCPFCKEGRPINTKFGHGREFLARKK